MPKMKTRSGAAKRFKVTAGGIRRNKSHRRHILTKKTTKRKRHLRAPSMLHKADVAAARRMMPYA